MRLFQNQLYTFLLGSWCALATFAACPDGWATLILIIEKIVHMWKMCSQHSCWFSPETLYIAQHTSPNNTCKLGNICPVRLTISPGQIPVETAPHCTFHIARHYLALVEPLKGRASLTFSVCCREEVCKCDLWQFRICVKEPVEACPQRCLESHRGFAVICNQNC